MLSDKVRERLEQALVIWLTTVRADGQPQTSVVWFLLEDHEILMYSLADTARVQNINANSAVSLNLDGDSAGGAVVTIEGTARIDPDGPRAGDNPPYVGKYLEAIRKNGWTPDQFGSDYPVAIRISIDRVRAW